MRRYALGLLGLAVMAIGIGFSIIAYLGTSPISSLPYVASQISFFTVGTATIAMNVGFLILQILLRRRKFDPRQFAQLISAVVLGYLCDAVLWVIGDWGYGNYAGQWAYCLLGIVFVALGVAITVTSKVIVMGGEGLVVALSTTLIEAYGPRKWNEFGTVKVAFDVTLVLTASILSLASLGHVVGVREGTLAAAIFVGIIARKFVRRLAVLHRWLDRS